MIKTIIKSIAAGVFIGLALFILPFFLLQLFIVLMLLGAAFRLFAGRRMYGRHVMFADKVRSMSEEDYSKFKSRYTHGCRHRHEYTEHTVESTPQ